NLRAMSLKLKPLALAPLFFGLQTSAAGLLLGCSDRATTVNPHGIEKAAAQKSCVDCDMRPGSETFDLRGKDLSRLDFSGSNFSGLDLSGVDFSGALLRRAKFIGSNLENASFAGAELYETDLSLARLKGAQF